MCNVLLTFTTLWANSADDKLIISLFRQENRIWHSMQIVSNGMETICMKCQNLFSGKNKKTYFNMSSAENFTQSAKR